METFFKRIEENNPEVYVQVIKGTTKILKAETWLNTCVSMYLHSWLLEYIKYLSTEMQVNICIFVKSVPENL